MNLQRTIGTDITLGVFFAAACLTAILYMLDRTESLSASLVSTHSYSSIDQTVGDNLSQL